MTLKPIVVRVSYGDVDALFQALLAALRRGRPRILLTHLRSERQKRQLGRWRPYTIGDKVILVRMRRYLSRWPRRQVRPWWRHGETGAWRR